MIHQFEQRDIDYDLMRFDEIIQSKQEWIRERTMSQEYQQELKKHILKVIRNNEHLEEIVEKKKDIIENSELPEVYDDLGYFISYRKNIKMDKFEELVKEMNELNEQLGIDKLVNEQWNKDIFIEQQENINTYLQKYDQMKKYQYHEQDLFMMQNIEQILNLLGDEQDKDYLLVQQQRSKSEPLADLSEKQALLYFFDYLTQFFEYLAPNENGIQFLRQLQISQKEFTFYLIESDEQIMSLIAKIQENYLLYCRPNVRPILRQQIAGLGAEINIDEHVFLPKENQYSKIYYSLKTILVEIGLIEDQEQLEFQNMLINIKKFENYQRSRNILDCFQFMNLFGFTIK